MLQGTTQNDIIKEYLSRGTYAFPPAPSLRLIADTVAYTVEHVPRWNPVNVCSYHLQEAGATPVQEIAFAMATAIAVLDEVRPRVREDQMGAVFARISFFVNAGVRFVEEHAKLRAMAALWEALGRERYGVTDAKQLRFRYGVQVNSLGLTESQPENNVQRIVLEALAVTLGRDARARAIQLPAWNEALGLPRPWDQQWSLRIQQVLAYETDLLEYPDLFEGSVRDGRARRRAARRRAGRDGPRRGAGRRGRGRALHEGGAGRVAPRADRADRVGRAGAGRRQPLHDDRAVPADRDDEGGILVVDPAVEAEQVAALEAWRAERDEAAVRRRAGRARAASPRATRTSCRRRSRPRGRARPPASGRRRCATRSAPTARRPASARRPRRAPGEELAALRDEVARVAEALGRGLKILVGKPGLDGHSNGAEQIAVRARDAGMEVVYEGIRLTPGADRALGGRRGRARDRALDPLGLAPRADPGRARGAARRRRRRHPGRGRRDHPRRRRRRCCARAGVAAVYTPKDFELTRILRDVVGIVAERNGIAAAA